MKKIFFLLTCLFTFSTNAFSQFDFEQGQSTTGNRGADTIVRYVMTNLGAGSVGYKGANPTDTFYLYSDGDTTYWTADKDLVLKPQGGGGIVRIDGQIKISGGNPQSGSVLTCDANGLGTWSASAPPVAQFDVTYLEADSIANIGALVPLAWYNITDDSIYIQAITDSAFGLNGYYADSTIWELDAIEFDFANEHIQKRCDKRGNCVGSTFAVASLMGVNPIDVFDWGNDNVLGNTVKDAVFDLSSNPDPSAAGNIITFLSEVTVTSDENFWNNNITNSIVNVTNTSMLNNATVNSSDLDITGASNCNGCIIETSTVLLQGATNASECVVLQSSELTTNGNVSCFAMEIGGTSTVTLSDSCSASRMKVNASTVTASGGADINDSEVRKFSTLTVSDTVNAPLILLTEGNTATISGTVNAIGVKMATGALLTASGQAFIEGLIIWNISVVNISDSAFVSPGLIWHQSTFTASGNARVGNATISSSTVAFTDSAFCSNCIFEAIIDTFDSTLDTMFFTNYNGASYFKTLSTDNFKLNGSGNTGDVLTRDTNGRGTWQPAGGGSIQSAVATDAGTTNANMGVRTLKLKPAGTIAAHTVNFPPTPVDGQLFSITSNGQTITSLTLSAGVSTIVGALTTLLTGGATYVYDSADNQWSRID